MKCKHCNGTGKIKMPTFDDAMPILEEDCGKCHGTGEIEVTNEEYIRTCSTEELAEFIYKLARCCRYSCKECPLNGYCAVENSRDALAWLKEKRHE